MPVTCYICGRDFGTRSIGIHLPNCQKKWENEQEKLPKCQRRTIPQAPEGFDKILSGEIKGKNLTKVNQKAFEEFNDTALVPCENCQRTFQPQALAIHQRSCTQEKPMVKNAKGKSYTAAAKAKVNYPKLKSKTKSKPAPAKKIPSRTIKVEIEHVHDATAESSGDSNSELVTAGKTYVIGKVSQGESSEGDSSNRSSMLESGRSSNRSSVVGSSRSSEAGSNRNSMVEDHEIVEEEEEEEEVVAGDSDKENKVGEGEAGVEVAVKVVNTRPPPPVSVRGPGTFRKKATFTYSPKKKICPSREDIISVIENEEMFDHEEKRAELLQLIQKFIFESSRKEVMAVFVHPVFDDEENRMEIVDLLNEFIKLKRNNNLEKTIE